MQSISRPDPARVAALRVVASAETCVNLAECLPNLVERDALLAKPELTDQDQQRLTELREQLGALPHGDTPEGIEAMDIIRRAAKALKAKEDR